VKLNVASEFSQCPGPRYSRQGPHSAEELRRLIRGRLAAAVLAGDVLDVDLDGTAGYAASFLEETFGGLVREVGPQGVFALHLTSKEEPELIDEVRRYIAEAAPRSSPA
jgi:hypothetical protein